jgi:hypothetical protein
VTGASVAVVGGGGTAASGSGAGPSGVRAGSGRTGSSIVAADYQT